MNESKNRENGYGYVPEENYIIIYTLIITLIRKGKEGRIIYHL